jgi:hypothetical protein
MRLLRVIGSEELDCGCFLGIYELYSGQVVEVVDSRGEGCSTAWHSVGTVIPTAGMTLDCRSRNRGRRATSEDSSHHAR